MGCGEVVEPSTEAAKACVLVHGGQGFIDISKPKWGTVLSFKLGGGAEGYIVRTNGDEGSDALASRLVEAGAYAKSDGTNVILLQSKSPSDFAKSVVDDCTDR